MSYRTIALRLRRRGVLALPAAAVAALALASTANAATVVYTPGTVGASGTANGTALQTAVNNANANPPGTQNIIQLCGCLYQPAAPLTLTAGNLEITGPPLFAPGTANNQDPNINGGIASPQTDLLNVASGAVVLLKGFDIAQAATLGAAGVGVHGTVEIDNVGIDGEPGSGVIVYSGGKAAVNKSLVADNGAIGVDMEGGTASLNQDTITGNSSGGGVTGAGGGPIAGTVTMNNSLLGSNLSTTGISEDCGSALSSANTGNSADDTTCGAGATNTPVSTSVANFYGGPVLSEQLNSPTGTGNTNYCARDDERFYLRGGTCDAGSYQTSATQSSQTTGPTCTVPATQPNGSPNPNYGTNPATMVVDATDGGMGLGPDAISNVSISIKPGFTGTAGSVAWPIVGGTPSAWFDKTNPSGPASETDYPSTAAFPLTASKTAGDGQTGDTHWQFTASNWLGISTPCS